MTISGWDWQAREDMQVAELTATSDARGRALATVKIDRKAGTNSRQRRSRRTARS